MRVGVLALLCGLLAVPSTANAEVVVDDDPTILGPAEFVDRIEGIGYENDLYRTEAEGEGGTEVNAAEWSTAVASGLFRVDVWLPAEHSKTFAKYHISHVGGTSEVRLNQASGTKDSWISLGTYSITGAAKVRSTDASGFGGQELAWDAIRWTRVDPAPGADASNPVQIVDDPEIGGPTSSVNRFVGVGYDSDLLRTVAQGDAGAEVNWARWRPSLTSGRYRVDAFIPREHAATAVEYAIQHSAGLQKTDVDQTDFTDAWAALGTFEFNSATAAVRSTDATGTANDEMAWDAIRWTRVDAPTDVSTAPSPLITPEAFTPLPAAAGTAVSMPSRAGASADADRDGITDAQDGCPRSKAGRFDSDRDGCRDKLLKREDVDGVVKSRVLRYGRHIGFDLTALLRPRQNTSVEFRCRPCRYFTPPVFSGRPLRIKKLPSRVSRASLLARTRRFVPGTRIDVLVTRPKTVGRLYRIELRGARYRQRTGSYARRTVECVPIGVRTSVPCGGK